MQTTREPDDPLSLAAVKSQKDQEGFTSEAYDQHLNMILGDVKETVTT